MIKYFYKKGSGRTKKRIIRVLGGAVLISGLTLATYIFFPLISWQIYFASAFASEIHAPIPKPEVVDRSIVGSLISSAGNIVSGVNYSNAQNWFDYRPSSLKKSKVNSFSISIPEIKVQDAQVSTVDTDLSRHLINYPGTAVPSDKGTSVVFGHSTLPQLFDPSNYKTIFANAYKLEKDDLIFVNVEGITYTYKIYDISVVEPDDTSIFTQDLSDSYLTLVTCTPPGTIWKRLIIKSKLQKL
jgi:sortase A